MRKLGLVLILTVFLILISSPLTSDSAGVEDLKDTPQRTYIESYTIRGYISIMNDSHFDDVALAEGWVGNGSLSSPYIIEGYNISSDGSCIQIFDTTRYYIIRNCYLRHDNQPGLNFGLQLYSAPNGEIHNVTVAQKGYGMYLSNAHNTFVSNFTADSCETGLRTHGSVGTQITNVETKNCAVVGIDVSWSDVTITDAYSHHNEDGVWVHNWDGSSFSNSNFTDNNNDGMVIDVSDNIDLDGVRLLDNDRYGLLVNRSTDVSLANTEISGNLYEGVWLENTNSSTFTTCNLEYNGDYSYAGFRLVNSHDITLNGITSYWNRFGIEARYSDRLTFLNSNLTLNGIAGFYGLECDELDLSTSDIYENNDGMQIINCTNADMDNINLLNNDHFGLLATGSTTITVTDSEISDNLYEGVWIEDTDSCTFTRCVLEYNGDYSYAGFKLVNSHDNTLDDVTSYWNKYGIEALYSNGLTVMNSNLTENAMSGIYALECDGLDLSTSSIYNSINSHGVELVNSTDCTVTENEIYNNDERGVHAINCDGIILSDNNIFENGYFGIYVNSSSNSYLEGNNITGSVSSGVYISYSPYAQLIDNILTDNQDGINIYYSNYSYLEGNDVVENRDRGIHMYQCNFSQIIDNVFLMNELNGMQVMESHHCYLQDNIVSGTIGGNGVYLSNSNNATIVNNTLTENSMDGLVLMYANGTEIIGNNIISNGETGVITLYSHNGRVYYNTFYRNTNDGLVIRMASSWEVVGNTIERNGTGICLYAYEISGLVIESNIVLNSLTGISVRATQNCNITDNFVYDMSFVGIWLYVWNENVHVTNNIIYECNYGCYIFESGDCWVYYNDFVNSGTRHAIEFNNTGVNYWDDNISMGNWYTGIARDLDVLNIYDSGITKYNEDRYPMRLMWIDDAEAISYDMTTTGNNAEWPAYGHNPDYYELYLNDTLLDTGSWGGSNLTLNLDGFDVGLYELELFIFHVTGYNQSATVSVTVTDITPPEWVAVPEDQNLYLGDSLSYQVSATDLSGIDTGSWAMNDTRFAINDGLITNATALPVGDYAIQISVADIYGNELTAVILVHVLPEPTPTTTTVTTPPTTTTTTPEPTGTDMMMLIILAGAGGLVLIIIIAIVLKRRGG